MHSSLHLSLGGDAGEAASLDWFYFGCCIVQCFSYCGSLCIPPPCSHEMLLRPEKAI